MASYVITGKLTIALRCKSVRIYKKVGQEHIDKIVEAEAAQLRLPHLAFSHSLFTG